MTEQTLARELAAYDKALPSLLPQEGRYAVVVGDAIVGTFESYADALQEGYAKSNLSPFLVKKIAQMQDVVSFSRPLALCPA